MPLSAPVNVPRVCTKCKVGFEHCRGGKVVHIAVLIAVACFSKDVDPQGADNVIAAFQDYQSSKTLQSLSSATGAAITYGQVQKIRTT